MTPFQLIQLDTLKFPTHTKHLSSCNSGCWTMSSHGHKTSVLLQQSVPDNVQPWPSTPVRNGNQIVASKLCLTCFLHSWDLFGTKCLQKMMSQFFLKLPFNFQRKCLCILNGKKKMFKILNFINGLLLSSQANNTFQHSDHTKTSPKI